MNDTLEIKRYTQEHRGREETRKNIEKDKTRESTCDMEDSL